MQLSTPHRTRFALTTIQKRSDSETVRKNLAINAKIFLKALVLVLVLVLELLLVLVLVLSFEAEVRFS